MKKFFNFLIICPMKMRKADGKNEYEDEKIWNNEFDFLILHIKIRLCVTFHENLRQNFSFRNFYLEEDILEEPKGLIYH